MNIPKDWQNALADFISTSSYESLAKQVQAAYKQTTCYPAFSQLFYAMEATPFAGVKVVLLGQDPYPNAGQAQGMSFSVPMGVKFPPSLRNIFAELKEDVGMEIPFSGDLTSWATQGVLLLNASLSVEAKKAGSHFGLGWEQFTDEVIRQLSQQHTGIVFLLWGNFAQKKAKLIDEERHLILRSGHPSPMSANQGHWFGNKHFSQTNAYLESIGKAPIDWALI